MLQVRGTHRGSESGSWVSVSVVSDGCYTIAPSIRPTKVRDDDYCIVANSTALGGRIPLFRLIYRLPHQGF